MTKGKDSDTKCEECVQHKYGKKFDLTDADARNVFANCTPSMTNCVAVSKHYGESIECMEKSNKTSACPSCSEIED